jgi:CheY-like chemotaxis protein
LSSTKGPETPLAAGETILLVEDEPAIRDMCLLMLEKLGYLVLTANDPQEALQIAGKSGETIDLVLTDVVMPGMNGRELMEHIREIHPDIKTLFMSGYPADVIAIRGVLEEEVQFIQKPFSLKELGPKIREALKK